MELGVIVENLALIAIAVPMLAVLKAAVLYLLCRTAGRTATTRSIALLLPQGGNRLVLFAALAAASGLLDGGEIPALFPSSPVHGAHPACNSSPVGWWAAKRGKSWRRISEGAGATC